MRGAQPTVPLGRRHIHYRTQRDYVPLVVTSLGLDDGEVWAGVMSLSEWRSSRPAGPRVGYVCLFDGKRWTRPLSEWVAMIKREDGSEVPRYKLTEQTYDERIAHEALDRLHVPRAIDPGSPEAMMMGASGPTDLTLSLMGRIEHMAARFEEQHGLLLSVGKDQAREWKARADVLAFELRQETEAHEQTIRVRRGCLQGIELSAHATRKMVLAEMRLDRLKALINTPEVHDWEAGVLRESVHQIERWGTEHDAGKTAWDWFWLIGYLAQKAADAALRGNVDKAKHHTISTGAALLNWHRALTGSSTAMRPGIDPKAAYVAAFERADRETPHVALTDLRHFHAPSTTTIPIGTYVRTSTEPAGDDGWTAEARAHRRMGVTGWVREEGRGHGLCYRVEYEIGGESGWHNLEELILRPTGGPS